MEGIPWAALGACAAGLGSLLSGWAAYKLAVKREPEGEDRER